MSWPIVLVQKTTVSQIAAVLRTDAEVFGGSLEERVLLGLGGLAGTEGGSSGLLSASRLRLGGLVIETKSALCS